MAMSVPTNLLGINEFKTSAVGQWHAAYLHLHLDMHKVKLLSRLIFFNEKNKT